MRACSLKHHIICYVGVLLVFLKTVPPNACFCLLFDDAEFWRKWCFV